MGALHDGHLSLVDAAQAACQFTVVTIFVNPTQFGPREDLARYPRTLAEDLRQLHQKRVDLVFLPDPDEIYPPGYSTYVEPPSVATPWEGRLRPGHFRGVATVVLKLFQLAPADVAYFGQKDYQQALVVRRMVDDLNVPIEICVCPTVREPDGLALSSRNRYLAVQERQRATAIYRSLRRGEALIRQGQVRADAIRAEMENELRAAGFDPIDYVALADPESLVEQHEVHLPVVLLIAARLGQTRLIDNWLVR
jgi:pantoate--beta-alanine ligase